MLFVPEVAALVIEVMNLKTIFEDFNFEFVPTEPNRAPVALRHICGEWILISANRQQVTRIGDGVWVEWVGTPRYDLTHVDSNLFPSAEPPVRPCRTGPVCHVHALFPIVRL